MAELSPFVFIIQSTIFAFLIVELFSVFYVESTKLFSTLCSIIPIFQEKARNMLVSASFQRKLCILSSIKPNYKNTFKI